MSTTGNSLLHVPGPTAARPAADVSPAPVVPSAWAPETAPVETLVEGLYTHAVVRCRHVTLTAIALLLLACLNGQWRVGFDSAQYRGLAESLAEGRGYTFGGVPETMIYPGLPSLLAGLQLIFGKTPLPGLVAMTLLSGLTLLVIYRLIRLHFPQWVALCVTIGTGLNEGFVQFSQELMTDMPFLFGVVTSLLGWELLRAGESARSRVLAGVVLAVGLGTAAAVRPTFWLLAATWIGVCVWGLIRGPRKFHGISLAVLVGVWAVVLLLDPRSSGLGITRDGYVRMILQQIPQMWASLQGQIGPVTQRELPEAFFGEHMSPLSPLFSLLLVVGLVLVLRRQPLWGLFGLITVAVTLLFDFTSVNRYYLMILPILWLGWILLASHLVRPLREPWRNVALGALLLLGLGPNLGGVATFVVEQRRSDFLTHYRDGQFVPMVALAEQIRDHVPPGARVVGPYATVLTYFSGRRVEGADQLFLDKAPVHYLQLVQQFDPHYAVFPTNLYRAKDARLVQLFDRKLLVPLEVIAQDGETYLARVQIREVEGDWRDLPTRAERRAASASRSEPSTQPATQPARKRRPPAAVTAATTQPNDASQPAAAVAKKKKKKPTTTPAIVEAPATQPVVPAKKKRPATRPAAEAVAPAPPTAPAAPM
jgi:hypothetical protein